MQYKTEGTILRGKVRWQEHEERNTRYFYGLEKRNHENKTTTKLKLSNGDFTNDQFEILQEQMHFYKTLYSSDKNRFPDLNDSALSAFSENIISLIRK